MKMNLIIDTGDQVIIERRCEPKNVFGVHCKSINQGDVSGITCTCDTNNCNKDDQCTCGGAATLTLSVMTFGLVFVVNKFM